MGTSTKQKSGGATGATSKVVRGEGAGAPESTAKRFGSHLSTAGGLEKAFESAIELNCDCLQIFVKNQRQWTAKPLTEEQISAYLKAPGRASVTPVVAHASYLINMASPAADARAKSVAAMVDELERCEALGVSALVVHPGAHMKEGVDVGIERIAASLDEIHARTSGFKSMIALECTAGQGSAIGFELSHLARIIQPVKERSRLRVCLDTCHLFAAGYDLSNSDDYERMATEVERFIGFENVCCIHTNDSKTPCGSHVDRHEHIGHGKMGIGAFKRLLNDSRFAGIPLILETEKEKEKNADGVDWDVINLATLRGLID